ncbi:MAG TPA: Dyp-type peroxidase [Solirubrobacteraceae bacterium]|nr:Dyp-type peroxidase [Solirubrobacteraceae bacterium]
MSPVDRRNFLKGSLTALGAGAAGAAVGLAGADRAHAAAVVDLATAARGVDARELTQRVPFDASHQSGIVTPKAAQATFVALDSVAPNTTALFEGLQAISSEARLLSQGEPVGIAEVDDPPPDSGILGPYNTPDSLTVTIAYGASLFDHRYGLAAKRPPLLTAMPSFALDELDPARTGGDVLVQVCAGQRDTVVHTVRELMRAVAGHLTVRWMIDGFQTASRDRNPKANPRNLFAFRDGTANPEVTNAALMDELVWVRAGAREPAWTTDGTYMVVRAIRQHVEFWDRVGMLEQEQMIGRDRVTGAPLGGTDEFEDPRYELDPKGDRIPLDAHIRLANPRTPATAQQRILRRGYNYHRGVDEAGNLDQGLVFVAFNQDPERQFATIQRRLETEPMTDYVLPVGGGYFFAPPGARGGGDWVGSGMASRV